MRRLAAAVLGIWLTATASAWAESWTMQGDGWKATVHSPVGVGGFALDVTAQAFPCSGRMYYLYAGYRPGDRTVVLVPVGHPGLSDSLITQPLEVPLIDGPVSLAIHPARLCSNRFLQVRLAVNDAGELVLSRP